MRALIQRVTQASVTIQGVEQARIGRGLVVLVGIAADDGDEDADWMAGKIARMRIFPDDRGLMNRSVIEADGGLIAVSQFTLFASTMKGNRPSYLEAGAPGMAEPLYLSFVDRLARAAGRPVGTGVFAADMQIALVNDGPVTIWVDSRRRE